MKRLFVVFVALAMLAQPAMAEDKAKARASYRSASKHYDLGEYREALTDFKEAYRNFEEPSFLFNIGQCYRQLGENEQAIHFFRTFLSKVPGAPNYDEVSKVVDKLEQAVREKRAAAVTPPTTAPEPKPARVEEPPPTPAPAPVAPAPVAAPIPVAAVVVAPAPATHTPVYKKWWLWTTVVVVAGVGVGLGVGLTRPHNATADTNLGTFQPSYP